MAIIIRTSSEWPDEAPVEIVERKGLGHPDTLCDAIAERVCSVLCRAYRDRFGIILHHNVDKVLLCGGASRARFGGGDITQPIEIYLGGRATTEWRGVRVPVDELAIAACREVLAERLPLHRDVRVISRIRPGSSDLATLFARGAIPLANDTSCGVGFAPLTELERLVLDVERALNDRGAKTQHPELGTDVKVMGVSGATRSSSRSRARSSIDTSRTLLRTSPRKPTHSSSRYSHLPASVRCPRPSRSTQPMT